MITTKQQAKTSTEMMQIEYLPLVANILGKIKQFVWQFVFLSNNIFLPKLWMELWESGNKTCEHPIWELLTSCVSISLPPVCFIIPFSFCFFLVCSLHVYDIHIKKKDVACISVFSLHEKFLTKFQINQNIFIRHVFCVFGAHKY